MAFILRKSSIIYLLTP